MELLRDIKESTMHFRNIARHLLWMLSLTAMVAVAACSSGTNPVFDSNNTYWEDESNNTSSQADVMSLDYNVASTGSSFTGIISQLDPSEDWFRLTTTQIGELSATLTGYDFTKNDRMQIELFNSSLSMIDNKFIDAGNGSIATVSSPVNSLPGTYFARISSESGTLRYDLDPDFTSGGTATAYWEVEDNDSTSQADFIALDYDPATDGYDYTGVISELDPSDDWYRLTTTTTGRLSVKLTGNDLSGSQSLAITLYDGAQQELDYSILNGSRPSTSVSAGSSFNLPAGQYFVRIESASHPHQYDLTPQFVQ